MIQSATFWLILWATVIIFWLLPYRMRFSFLALASIGYLFVLWLQKTAGVTLVGIFALIAWTLAFYALAPYVAKGGNWRKWLLPASILAALGYLAYFKYIPPLIAALSSDTVAQQFIIPLGISYFTFKFIHYAIEVARGNIKDRSLPQFFCYIFLFPIFTAGPIERFDHFLANQAQNWQLSFIVEGSMRIIYGLIKKFFIGGVVLSPLFGPYDDAAELLAQIHTLPTYKVWGFLVLSYLYLYMDFSAYSDIAIGASRLFGIRILENFDFPILAPNISIFWKRWHMTLAGWCQAYVYMPMIGLTRNPYLAVYSTMTAIALWHAGTLNRLFWGWYHATGLVVYLTWARYKRQKKWNFFDKHPILRHSGIPLTFLFVTGSFMFSTTDGYGGMYGALRILAKLFFVDLPA